MGSRSTCRSAEASLAGRLTAAVALCAVLGSTVGCAAVGAGTSTLATLGYRLCGAPDRASVFELSVRQNGEVEYSGSVAAHIAGKQSVQIDPQVASQIHRAIAFAVRESKKSSVPRPTVASYELCLTVHDATSQYELNSGREQTRRLIDLVNDTVDPRRWACPSAQALSNASLNWQYCDRPRLSAAFRDEMSCGLYNMLEIYGDGAIHFYAADDADPTDKPSSHQFARISSEEIETLLSHVRTYKETVTLEVFPDQYPPPKPRATYEPGRMCGRPEDLRAFKGLVSGLVPLRWADGRGAGRSCAASTPLPTGLVSLVEPWADGQWSKRYSEH